MRWAKYKSLNLLPKYLIQASYITIYMWKTTSRNDRYSYNSQGLRSISNTLDSEHSQTPFAFVICHLCNLIPSPIIYTYYNSPTYHCNNRLSILLKKVHELKISLCTQNLLHSNLGNMWVTNGGYFEFF